MIVVCMIICLWLSRIWWTQEMTRQWCLLKNGLFCCPCSFCIGFATHDLLCPAAQGYRQVLKIRNATNPAVAGRMYVVFHTCWMLVVLQTSIWDGMDLHPLDSCFVTKTSFKSQTTKTVLSISKKGWQDSGALAVDFLATTTQRHQMTNSSWKAYLSRL